MSFLADFFHKYNVAVMTVRELFEFVTDPSITNENMDAYLEKVMVEDLSSVKIFILKVHTGSPHIATPVGTNNLVVK